VSIPGVSWLSRPSALLGTVGVNNSQIKNIGEVNKKEKYNQEKKKKKQDVQVLTFKLQF